jgi:hypothetical protein
LGLVRTKPLDRFDDVTTSVNLSTTATGPHPLVGGFVELLPILPSAMADYGQISARANYPDHHFGWFCVAVACKATLPIFSAAAQSQPRNGTIVDDDPELFGLTSD